MRIQYISGAAGGGRGREREADSKRETTKPARKPRFQNAAVPRGGRDPRAEPTGLGGPKRHLQFGPHGGG